MSLTRVGPFAVTFDATDEERNALLSEGYVSIKKKEISKMIENNEIPEGTELWYREDKHE